MCSLGNKDTLSASDMFVRVQDQTGSYRISHIFTNMNEVFCNEYVVMDGSHDKFTVRLEDKDMIGTQVIWEGQMDAGSELQNEHLHIYSVAVPEDDVMKYLKTLQDEASLLGSVRRLLL